MEIHLITQNENKKQFRYEEKQTLCLIVECHFYEKMASQKQK